MASGVVLCAVLAIVADASALRPIDAIILGAVEGITEFLPVSSTGHLLVTERLLGLGSGTERAAADTYAIAIQFGAILAVVGVYRNQIASMLRGVVGRDDDGRHLAFAVALAFVPSALVGFVFDDAIKAHLFGVWPIVAAWIIGGVFLIVWRPKVGRLDIGGFTWVHAAVIGAAQILALWPGTSRSLVTIVAALALGATMAAAVEFSFLLGLATLSAASLYSLATDGGELFDQFGVATVLIGFIVAAITAFIAVTWFVNYLKSRGLALFGWYRLGVAALAIALAVTGVV